MEFQRVNISGGSSFEEVAGYSRIVKADPFVFVSGTTAVTPEVCTGKVYLYKTGEAAGRKRRF